MYTCTPKLVEVTEQTKDGRGLSKGIGTISISRDFSFDGLPQKVSYQHLLFRVGSL